MKKILDKVDSMIRRDVAIDDVLNFVDKELLVSYLGFSYEECINYRNIWRKLQKRRMQRQKY